MARGVIPRQPAKTGRHEGARKVELRTAKLPQDGGRLEAQRAARGETERQRSLRLSGRKAERPRLVTIPWRLSASVKFSSASKQRILAQPAH